jgi:hypothetical protein
MYNDRLQIADQFKKWNDKGIVNVSYVGSMRILIILCSNVLQIYLCGQQSKKLLGGIGIHILWRIFWLTGWGESQMLGVGFFCLGWGWYARRCEKLEIKWQLKK